MKYIDGKLPHKKMLSIISHKESANKARFRNYYISIRIIKVKMSDHSQVLVRI